MFCLNFNCKLTLMFKLATIQYPVNCYPAKSGKVVPYPAHPYRFNIAPFLDDTGISGNQSEMFQIFSLH